MSSRSVSIRPSMRRIKFIIFDSFIYQLSDEILFPPEQTYSDCCSDYSPDSKSHNVRHDLRELCAIDGERAHSIRKKREREKLRNLVSEAGQIRATEENAGQKHLR